MGELMSWLSYSDVSIATLRATIKATATVIVVTTIISCQPESQAVIQDHFLN